MKNIIVLALGGNALGNTPEEQKNAVKVTAKSIVDLVSQGKKVIVVHGNGPQVGMIYNAFDISSKCDDSKIPSLSLALSGAMSQGYIGLHLQQAINNELNARNIDKPVASIVTQTIVDKNDPAFENPTKPIGNFMSEEEAKKVSEATGAFVGEDAGRGWRVMVPSPKPVSIAEVDIITQLVDNDNIIIAGGGGGIPSLRNDDGSITELDAVIDKDFTAAKIATLVDADTFMIVTAEDGIWKDYGKETGHQLKDPEVAYLQELVDAGEFPAGSMRPKVEAVISYINNASREVNACITSLELAADALEGNAGTWVTKK